MCSKQKSNVPKFPKIVSSDTKRPHVREIVEPDDFDENGQITEADLNTRIANPTHDRRLPPIKPRVPRSPVISFEHDSPLTAIEQDTRHTELELLDRSESTTPSECLDYSDEYNQNSVIISNLPIGQSETHLKTYLESKGFSDVEVNVYLLSNRAYVKYSSYSGYEECRIFGKKDILEGQEITLLEPDCRRLFVKQSVNKNEIERVLITTLSKRFPEMKLKSVTYEDEAAYVVTFRKQSQELDQLIKELEANEDFGNSISWQRLEKTTCLAITGIPTHLTLTDVHKLRYSHEATDVKWTMADRTAFLYFKESIGMEMVIRKIQRAKNNERITVQPQYSFYKFPKVILSNLKVSFNKHIFSHVNNHLGYREQFDTIIAKAKAKIVTMDDDGNLTLEFDVFGSTQSDHLEMVERKEWCERSLCAFISNYTLIEVDIPEDIDLDVIKSKTSVISSQATQIEVHFTDNLIRLVGLNNSVDAAKLTLFEIIDEEQFGIEATTITLDLPAKKWEVVKRKNLLNFLPANIVVTTEEIKSDQRNMKLILSGPRKEIRINKDRVTNTINQEVCECRYTIPSVIRLSFPQGFNIEQYLIQKFSQENVSTIISMEDEWDVLTMGTESDLIKSSAKIRSIFHKDFKRVISGVRQRELLEKEVFRNIIREINNRGDIQVLVNPENNKILIRGIAEKVNEKQRDVQKFLTENEIKESQMKFHPAKLDFLDQHNKESLIRLQEELDNDFVKITVAQGIITLRGTSRGLKTARAKIDSMNRAILESSVNVEGKTAMFDKGTESTIIKSIHQQYPCIMNVIRTDEQLATINPATILRLEQENEMENENRPPTNVLHLSQGKSITLVKGNIAKENVDVIVNNTSSDLNLQGGVSRILSKAAGPNLKKMCEGLLQSHGGSIPVHGVDTPGYNLHCKRIYHIITPGKNDEEGLRRVIQHSLTFASKSGYTSISIPAIGTRVNNFPRDVVARSMYEEAVNFYNDTPSTSLKDIRLVVFDSLSIAAFELELGRRLGSSIMAATESAPPCSKTATHDTITVGGTRIYVYEGDIIKEQVDCIANTISHELGYGQLGQRLVQLGGEEIHSELQQKGLNNPTMVITTGPGTLQFKRIYHTKIPTDNQMKDSVLKCLTLAETDGMTSIALPAIGTGSAKRNVIDVARGMLDGIVEYAVRSSPTCLRSIKIVIWPVTPSHLQPFLNALQEKHTALTGVFAMSTFPGSSVVSAEDDVNDYFEDTSKLKATESAPPCSKTATHDTITVGGTQIYVYEGDIIKEQVDSIANTISHELGYGQLGQRLVQLGGEEIHSELQQKGQNNPAMVITTGPGTLQFKRIYHTKIPTNDQMKDSVLKCLTLAETDGMTSIALPAIGTGSAKRNVIGVARGMLDGIVEYAVRSSPTCLRSIKIVIWPVTPSHLQPFLNALQEKHTALTGVFATSTFPGSSVVSAEDDFDDYFEDTSKLKDTLVSILGKYIVTHRALFEIKIFAGEQNVIDTVKDEIQDAIRNFKSHDKEFNNELIGKLKKEDIIELEETASKCDITITVDVEKSTISITGDDVKDELFEDFTSVFNKITKRIKQRRKREKASAMAEKVQWYYIDEPGEKYIAFDKMDNFALEKHAGTKKNKLKCELLGQNACVSYKNKFAIFGTRKLQLVRRSQTELDLPPYWKEVRNDDVIVEDINNTSDEYQEAYKLFFDTLGSFRTRCKVIKIQRVQNPWRYRQYMTSRRKFEDREYEKRLFHGTHADNVTYINRENFNRSYQATNVGARFGQGSYFAKDSEYSIPYSQKDSNDTRLIMYLVRVLVGEYARGNLNMKAPPVKDTRTQTKYDSTVDDPANPTIFVVYDDTFAYPEFIIHFEIR
ncbi:protein mono-ADP-ribosyltransferase PARP14-like [Saccoglossus kowalevskii]